jgi:hypothetical protein
MPSIPALGRQRQEDRCKFEASLVYKVSSRTARVTIQRNPVFERKKKKKERKILFICDCVSISHRCPNRPEKNRRSFGAEVTGTCGPPFRCWKPNWSPLET